MPAERSHMRAAAGLHGASSAKSMAFAALTETARKAPINRHAKSAGFILNRPSSFLGSRLHNGLMKEMPAFLCVAQIKRKFLSYRKNWRNARMNLVHLAALVPQFVPCVRHPKAAAKRPSKDGRPRRPGPSPFEARYARNSG